MHPTRPRFRSLPLWIAVCFAACASFVHAKKPVAISATADNAYVDGRTDENGERKIEKYVVMEGTFFPGEISDKSLETTELIEIVRALAPHLAKQSYLPTKDGENADIVIAVHWGTSVSLRQNIDYVMDSLDRARNEQAVAKEFYDSHYAGLEDTGDPAMEMLRESTARAANNPDMDWVSMANSNSQHDIRNRPMATILGFSKDLNVDANRMFTSAQSETLKALMDEERYFIVLMAYDLKNREDGKPLRRLWVARLSIPAAGVNFREAIEQLGKAGEDFYGTETDGVKITRPNRKTPTGEVEIGETTVIPTP